MAYIVTIYGIQAESGTTHSLFASWHNEAFDHFDHYKVKWWYSTGDNNGFLEKEEETSLKYSRFNAPDNATKVTVQVIPVSATYTVNDTEVSYWWGEWAHESIYFGSDIRPEVPPTPSVAVKDYKLTASLDNLKPIEFEGKTNWIYFEVVRNDQYVVVSEGKAKIITGHAQFSCDIGAGGEYKVRAKAVRTHKSKTIVKSYTRKPSNSSTSGTWFDTAKNTMQNMTFTTVETDVIDDNGVSGWSDYSSNVHTKPESSDGLLITTCRAQTTTSVYLAWSTITGATTYDIEYATEKGHLGSSDASSTVSGIEFTHYEKTGLTTGAEYFFRLRATNDAGSSDWSPIVSVVLGKTPSAPTTWSSSTTCMVGDNLILSWLHNAEDGSTQTYAQIEIYVNGVKETYTIDSTTEEDDKKTMSYTIDTSSYTEGTKIQWRVRTAGVTKDYGDWSIQRTVDVYAVPSLNLAVTDSTGNTVQTLSSFPIKISATAGPATQSPVGYYLTFIANQAYTATDSVGNHKNIVSGDEVYSKYFDISTDLSVVLSAGDISLQNGISYTIVCTVSMNSGLNASSTLSFTVAWTATSYTPNAELGIDYDSVSAIIRPYCKDNAGALVQNVTLAVYRREIDGSFTEIMSNLNNVDGTFITDPHPALNYARYRVVATDTTTGVISYSDLPLFPVNEKACIIQWNEEWRSFDSVNSNRYANPVWSGSFLRLPYNIDVSNSYSVDSSLVEYIGRKHPISYYGTQLGEGETWNVVVPKSDIETLYALRRLAVWTGDAYVREPSGSGYWANVGVSFSQKHRDVTVPVTLTIKRVSGGI
jgi:hypothetical protein|nr:MAG TPA_asm: FN3 [Caudoviricetes sp.]